MDYYEKLILNVKGLNNRFPDGDDPFKIVTRLCEEAGEVAKSVNHAEKTGIKSEKYGEHDKKEMAKEVMDVLRVALQVAVKYDLRDELEQHIDASCQKLKDDGYLS